MSTMELCASTPVNLAAHEHSLDLDTARMLMPSALVSLLQGAEVQAAKAAVGFQFCTSAFTPHPLWSPTRRPFVC